MDRESPYQGLNAFGEADRAFFSGRTRDVRLIVANLFASRFTILHGPSGVGKTSVLQAGVIPALRAREGVTVKAVRDWSGDPAQAVRDAITTRGTMLILDQFEDALAVSGGEEALAAALRDPRASVLVSIREESLAQLDRFEGLIGGLFDTVLRLDHLDRADGAEAIRAPLAAWPEPVEVEPALIEAVLDGVPAGRGKDGIETAHLQLVMARVWDAERAAGTHILRAATLASLGGAAGIVSAHVRSALESLPAADRDLMATVLDRLVTPSGARIAHRTGDLAAYADVPPERLRPLLDRLSRARLLRPVEAPGESGPRHEIFHEILADAVLAWLTEREAERREALERARWRRRVRAALAVAALAVTLAVAAAAALYARAQHQTANSRALAASARRMLEVDPATSLTLALAAVRQRETSGAEDALRAALAVSHERVVIRTPAPLRSAGLTAGGLIVAGDDGVARSHDRAGRPLGTPAGSGAIHAASCGAGRIAAVGDGGAFLTTPDGKVTLGDETPADAVACNAAGTRIAVLDQTGRTTVFAPDGRRVARLPPPASFAGPGIGISGDGLAVITLDEDQAIVWRVGDRSAVAVRRLDLGQSGVSAALNRDGTRAVTGGSEGGVVAWDVRSGGRVELPGHRGRVETVAFSPDGALVASGGDDRTARLWDAATGTPLAVLRGHTGNVTSVAVDSRTVATASDDRTARLWSTPATTTFGVPVSDATFTGDGRRVVTAGFDGVHTFDAGGRQRAFVAVPNNPAHVAASRDGSRIVVADAEGRGVLVNGDGSLTILGAEPEMSVAAVDISDDGNTIALGLQDGSVRLVDPAGTTLRTVRATGADPITGVALAPDASRLAIGSFRGGAAIVDARTGEVVVRVRTRPGGAESLAFGPDDTVVIGGADDAQIRDARDGRLVQSIRGVTVGVRSAALSPDGVLLLTAGVDGAARLTDTNSGDTVADLPAGRAQFSPGGGQILTVEPKGVARLYPCDACGSVKELMARAERRITRPLTPAQLDAFAR